MCQHVCVCDTLHELLLALLLNNRVFIGHTVRIATATDERPVPCNVHNVDDGVQRRERVPTLYPATLPDATTVPSCHCIAIQAARWVSAKPPPLSACSRGPGGEVLHPAGVVQYGSRAVHARGRPGG